MTRSVFQGSVLVLLAHTVVALLLVSVGLPSAALSVLALAPASMGSWVMIAARPEPVVETLPTESRGTSTI